MPTRGLINPELLTGIADAIREKNGSNARMTPAQMADAVGGLVVTPEGIVTATGQMTTEQAAHTRENIGVVIDPTLTIDGATADAKATGDAISALFGSGISAKAKQAFLSCFDHVYWSDDQGPVCIAALKEALFPPVSISAVFTQGDNIIYNTDSLDTIRQYLVVTALYEDGTTKTVTDYTLSGSLVIGTSTITVEFGGKTDTFNVTVTSAFVNYQVVEWVGASTYRIANWNAKIDLGYAPKVKPRAVFRIQEYAISANSVFDLLNGSATGSMRFHWYVGTSGPRYYYHYGTASDMSGSSITIAAETWYNVDISDVVKINGVQRNIKPSADWSSNEKNLFLFYGGEQNAGSQTYSGSRISYFKLYDGEELMRDLVPCYRKTDGQVGFWDNVEEKFFTSADGNPLQKGADVNE